MPASEVHGSPKAPTLQEHYAGIHFGEPPREDQHDSITRRLKKSMTGHEPALDVAARKARGLLIAESPGSTLARAMGELYKMDAAFHHQRRRTAREILTFWRSRRVRQEIIAHVDEMGLGIDRSGCLDYIFERLGEYVVAINSEVGVSPSGPSSDAALEVAPPWEQVAPAPNNPADRRTDVDRFLLQCNQEPGLSEKIFRKHIWKAVNHTQPRQFQHWQAGHVRVRGRTEGANQADHQNFDRILSMKPADFLVALRKKRLLKPMPAPGGAEP